jgi:hypothetical protein
MTFRKEITGLLEDEIIGRYLYEEGSIAWSLKNDEQVLRAVDILNQNEKYKSILQGKEGSILITTSVKNNAVKKLLYAGPEDQDNL